MTNEEVISRLKQLLVTKRNIGDLLDVEAISCALNVFEEWDYNIKLSALELEQQLRDCKTCKHSDNGNCSGSEECHECMWESKYEQQPCEDCISREETLNKINALIAEYIPLMPIGWTLPLNLAKTINDLSPVTPYTDILDKIRNEITEKESEICSDTSENVALKVAYIEALKIIDKFR